MKKGLVWFRTDLRLHDHFPLQKALQECDAVLPVFFLDDRLYGNKETGFIKASARRLQFLLETLRDLQKSLQSKGADLLFILGRPEEHLPQLVKEHQITHLFFSKEATTHECQIEQKVNEALPSLKIQSFFNHTLVDPSRMPFAVDELPDLFTNFRQKVERQGVFPRAIPVPDSIKGVDHECTTIPTLEEWGLEIPVRDDRTVFPFRGGENAGLDRVEEYVWNTEAIASYKITRNGLLGENYSSKFSPWLALGALSPRFIADEIADFEEQVEKNDSTYWMIFELLWRDFFRLNAMKQGSKLFQLYGFKGTAKHVNANHSEAKWQQWTTAQTGDDFVDANMRELLLTGFMSNRGRQNVASFAVHDLGLNWLKCAAFFEYHLLDYDPASNYGNWAYVAGVGNDARPDRKFNTKKQANDYDANGAYRKTWVNV